MECAVQTLVKVFLKSSKGSKSLGKKQFQTLVKNQLSNILSDTESKEAVNNMGKGLDSDHDGKVGFEEYMKLIGYLASSLSEQRNVAKEEPAQNAVCVEAQSGPDKEEEKPGAKAEAKAEPKAEAKAEAKPEVKEEAKEEAKVEAVANVNVERHADGYVVQETQSEAAKEEEKPAAAVVEAALEEATVEVVLKEEQVKVETEKVEEAAEKLAAAVEEEVEKKIDEATS